LDGAALGVLRQAARLEAGRNLRVAATLGGTLAVAGSEDLLAVVLLALDAELLLVAPSQQRLGLEDFLADRERHLAGGHLMTEVTVPLCSVGTAAAFARVGRTPLDRPIVCAAAQLTLTDGLCLSPRLSLGGVAERPVRLRQVEDIIAEKALGDDLLTAAVESAMAAVSPTSDYRGSADYRRALVGILTRRVLTEAAELASTVRVDGLGA
jgi:CO/xanthine dehydrogenase FAD-binding subunit